MNIIEKVQTICDKISLLKSNFKNSFDNKGVTISDDVKLKDYPNFIANIHSDTDTSDANATSEVLREGYTAYARGQKIYGTAPLAQLFISDYLTVACESGFIDHYSSITLTDFNLRPENILYGTTIFGVTGNINLSNLKPENIKEGININGVIGIYRGSDNNNNTNNPSDSTTATASYILSGSAHELANGEYYLTNETYADFPVYKNANGYVIYMTPNYGWCIAESISMAPIHGAAGNYDVTPPTTGWYGEMILVKQLDDEEPDIATYTCIWCGHTAPQDSTWPLCPGCGKFQ